MEFFNKRLEISGISPFFRTEFLVWGHGLLLFIKIVFFEGWFVWCWFSRVYWVKADILWMSWPPQRIPLLDICWASIIPASNGLASMVAMETWSFPWSTEITQVAGLHRAAVSRTWGSSWKRADLLRFWWMQHWTKPTITLQRTDYLKGFPFTSWPRYNTMWCL